MKGREIGMFVGWEFLCRGNKCIHLLTKSKEALRLPLKGRPILLNKSYDYRLNSDPLSSIKYYEIANENSHTIMIYLSYLIAQNCWIVLK